MCGVDTKEKLVEIPYFRHFVKHFIFTSETFFEFIGNKKQSFVIFLSVYFILISLFFSSLTPLISSFVDAKWKNYFLLEELVKQYGVELDYSFKDESLPPTKTKPLNPQYSVKLKGDTIYFRKFMNSK